MCSGSFDKIFNRICSGSTLHRRDLNGAANYVRADHLLLRDLTLILRLLLVKVINILVRRADKVKGN